MEAEKKDYDEELQATFRRYGHKYILI